MSLALSKWDFELTDILLEKGAKNMPFTSFDINEVNSQGESRLAAAFRRDFYRVAAFLLQCGASKSAGLVVECVEGDPNMERLKWLIDHGFEIDELNKVLLKNSTNNHYSMLGLRFISDWRHCFCNCCQTRPPRCCQADSEYGSH